MADHGGGVPLQLTAPTAAGDSPNRADAGNFRHFIRTPEGTERFRIFGQPPEENPERTLDLLGRLGKCLVHGPEYWTTALADGLQPWENPCIPSGYTYLGQLVAHDLVQTSQVFPNLEGDRAVLRNSRTFGLDLDTLYGPGPAACPHAYAVQADHTFRTRLRLSRMSQSSPDVQGASPPFRDIGRGRACLANDAVSEGSTEALLADPRNDDNAVLSQVTTIFIHLHNAVLAGVERERPLVPPYPASSWRERQYLLARRLVTDAYRAVLRHDLLPRIIDTTVLAHYAKNPTRMLDAADGRMPLEFSHAAYRFGHAMVRPRYSLNDRHDPFDIETVMRHTSRRQPQRLPLNENWIVQWSRFFDLGNGSPVNLSRRIAPHFSHGLELPANGYSFPDDQTPRTLAQRDFLRSAAVHLWSVRALVDEIGRRQRDLISRSRALADLDDTLQQLEQWLRQQRESGVTQFSDEEVAAIAQEPPLLLFILFEAALEADGRHLGTLGSIIVGETLMKQLDADREPEVGDLAERILGAQPIKTMPELLNVLADRFGLKDALPPFL